MLIAPVLAVGLSGCGLSAAAAPAPPSASLTGAQIYQRSLKAFARVRSVEIDERFASTPRSRASLTLRMQTPNRLEVAIRGPRAELTGRYIGTSTYVNARKVGVSAEDARLADRNTGAGRWAHPSLPASLRTVERLAQRGRLAHCMLRPAPAREIRLDATSSYEGVATDVISIAASRGMAAERLTVASTPPFLPLQLVRSFPARVAETTHLNRTTREAYARCGVTQAALKTLRDLAKHTKHPFRVHSETLTLTGYNTRQGIVRPPHPGPASASSATRELIG